MPIRKINFTNGEFYHVFNRGVEKRSIFLESEDYLRFIHDLYEFNDEDAVINNSFFFDKNYRFPSSIVKPRKKRKLLVEIICFCLMPNHWHLLLRQLKDNGITLFMKKLGGYATYFNKKYERVGSLFQGRFKALHINNDEYLTHLSRYIHINSVELVEPDWKETGVKDLQKVLNFLESYRWSSCMDYIGKKNFPSVISKDFLNSYFKNSEDHRNFIIDILRQGERDLEKIKNFCLE